MRRLGPGLVVFAMLFVAYAWFYQAGGWNQNSRLDLVRALVEQGTVRVDAYHLNTGDKARVGDHVYSDKAPGLALAAAPVAAIARPLLPAPAEDEAGYVVALSYLVTLATAALPMALAGLLVFALARRLGAGGAAAAIAALAFGLGTPAWCYATLFIGHALATGLLAAAFAAAVALAAGGSARRDLGLGAGLGLAGGWATITELPVAPAAAMVAALALVNVGRARAPRVGAAAAAGASLAVAALAAYNLAAFGSPWQTGYTHVEGFEGMRAGFFGVTYPRPEVLWELTFGSYRGLFFHAPVLLAAPFGLAILWRRGGAARRAAITVTAVGLYFLLFNASYHYWDGGWAYGPRHLMPALPLLALGLAPAWEKASERARDVIGVLAFVSAGFTLAAVATTPTPPTTLRRPLFQLHLPALARGDLSMNPQSFLEAEPDQERLARGEVFRHAWSLGSRAGLPGLAQLAPLLVVLGGGGVVLWRRRDDDEAG